jgi:hypothetical protein
MKPTKLMLGTLILGLGIGGAAWAQPAPNHGHEASVYRGYSADRSEVNRARGDQDDRNFGRGDRDDAHSGENHWYANQRGDGDHDRDDRSAWQDRDGRHDGWRGDRDARGFWNWGHSDLRRGKRDDR